MVLKETFVHIKDCFVSILIPGELALRELSTLSSSCCGLVVHLIVTIVLLGKHLRYRVSPGDIALQLHPLILLDCNLCREKAPGDERDERRLSARIASLDRNDALRLEALSQRSLL